jgi:hypothetical protein
MPGTLETLTALAAFPTYRAVSNEALIRCAAMRITEAASPAKSRVYPRAADVKSFSSFSEGERRFLLFSEEQNKKAFCCSRLRPG